MVALFLGVVSASYCEASTNFYVDPDWAGAHSGTASQPWAYLDSTAWNAINSALASGDVTVYFSALKANGTQQSAARFIQCRRTDPGSNRLTLDGYSEYNSNETNPSWLSNSDTDINHAYLNGKVFKTTGDGSQALGWVEGNDFVTRNGSVYCCIESHVAASDNEPGIGANWRLYWDQHGTAGAAEWGSGTTYKCYVKQNNVTLRGFECTGSGARTTVAGDNLIFEYIYIHDITTIGPGLYLSYTSHPDSSLAQIVARPSTNLVFHYFKIKNTYGEGFYLGSINPDSPGAFQLAHGNQHNHILIENFVIDHPGANGAQGDAIDGKSGITYLTIRLGEITGFGGNGNGINIGLSATNTNQNILIERNYIHDSTQDLQGAQRGIHAQTGGGPDASLYGLNGITIRNNIVTNCAMGIEYDGATGQPAINGAIFNNTIYNITPNSGIVVTANISSTTVQNNFVFAGANPKGQIAASGVTSDYNAHDGSWSSASEGPHTLALGITEALLSVVNATNEDFHLVFGAPIINMAEWEVSFSDDFDGHPRGIVWDISAYQFAPAATPTPIPSPTPTPTATPTATPAPTATPTPTPTPPSSLCTVPNFIGQRVRRALSMWTQAGFNASNIATSGRRGQRISWQSLPAGSQADCATAMVSVGP